MDGWNTSNHNLKYLPQEITFQRHILCFKIRKINLQALAQRRENSAAACKFLPSGADLPAPLSSQSYAKPKFMGPQKRHDGKHPDDMIRDFRALLVVLATGPGKLLAVRIWTAKTGRFGCRRV